MSESTLKQLSLYDLSRKGSGLYGDDDDDEARARRGEGGKENGDQEGGKEGDEDKKEEEDEDDWLGTETEEEKKARKEREKEEQLAYEEELRKDKELRDKMEKMSLKDALSDDEAICCAEKCGKTTKFHPCPCLAPVRQDAIPYDALLEKRKAEHPEWYVDPYGLGDEDHANKVLRMLMGEISEEEANKLLDNIMTEEEKKEDEHEDLESPTGSNPEPLSRASSPGSFDLSGGHEDDETLTFEEEDEEYRWPTCREFTVELGIKAIDDFIETRWNLPDHYKFCVDFLGSVQGPPEQFVEDFYFRAKFSVPTRLEPIPLQRASIHFIISVMLHHDRPREEKVYVAYYMESKRTRFSAETPFRLEWLQMVMENKHRLADDWGSKRTNLYQYVLDGPESGKKKDSLPLSSTDSQGFWIPNY